MPIDAAINNCLEPVVNVLASSLVTSKWRKATIFASSPSHVDAEPGGIKTLRELREGHELYELADRCAPGRMVTMPVALEPHQWSITRRTRLE